MYLISFSAIESTPTNIQWNSDKKKKKNKSLSGVFEITEHAGKTFLLSCVMFM